jgi:hypothetical protein
MMAQIRPALTMERIAIGVSIAATLLAPALTYAVTQAVMQQSISELRAITEDHEARVRRMEDNQAKLLVTLERIDVTLKMFMRGEGK